MLTVVAALIERDDRILICRRAAGQSHAGKWEFPGGKVEAGEIPRDALCRELKEELAIDASIGEEVERYTFAYAGKPPIQLIFFKVMDFDGELENRIFDAIEWAPVDGLPAYDFLEGDVDFVERLSRSRGPNPTTRGSALR